MASTAQLEALRSWLQHNGGFLHPEAILAYNDTAGVHCRAAGNISATSRICMIPHCIALSSLNALVDDKFPVFRNRGLAPEAIGYFYLMHQYLNQDASFWNVYLRTLPTPESDLRTPFWFDHEDEKWLERTDVLFTANARQRIHEEHYRKGISMLEAAKVDTSSYTWTLYKWAVTMFTSRSFASRALHPQESKYWTAYKYDPDGRRQTVLLDMSHTSAEDLDFPVLFPVLDILNHRHDTTVDWSFDPGRFTVSLVNEVTAGAEIFNNYGPKSNDELLLGYGFCIEDNPNDKVLMTLKAPPESLQQHIRTVQPGYFETTGEWSSAKATFGLRRITLDPERPSNVFEQLPASLLELLAYMIRHERRLPFAFIDHPRQALIDDNSPSSYFLPHITRMIVTSLAPKYSQLQSSNPTNLPANAKQVQAAIYRNEQLKILESVISALRTYLRSLLHITFTHPQPPPQRPFITTVDGLLELLGRHSVQAAAAFADGIVANAGTADMRTLREAGWEEDLTVLLLCYCQLTFGFELPEYCIDARANVEGPLLAEEMEQATGLMELVRVAAQARPDSLWATDGWDPWFITRVGGRMFVHESFLMAVPDPGLGREAAQPVIYIHGIKAGSVMETC